MGFFNCTNLYLHFVGTSSLYLLACKAILGFRLIVTLHGDDVEGLLWIELEGKDKRELMNEFAEISEVIYDFTNEEILVAESSNEINKLWFFRKNIGNAVMSFSSFKDLDVVVPRSKIHQMYNSIKNVSEEYKFKYTAFGHIGNGNFHINIFNDHTMSEEQWKIILSQGVSEIFKIAVDLGGTISGEHGIGEIHRSHLNYAIPECQLSLMKEIKKIFDPNKILNPEIIF